MLTESEKSELLTLVRRTLEAHLKDNQSPYFEILSPTIKEPAGAFVTLYHGEDLRGCIGVLDAKEPLFKTAQSMAIAAATNDPRFRPVHESELTEIHIEISIISPRRPLENIKDVEIGLHGLYVARDHYRGILLPQVAVENKWNREEFLSHTCVKAGLSPDAWEKGDLTIEVFTAEVCSEPLKN